MCAEPGTQHHGRSLVRAAGLQVGTDTHVVVGPQEAASLTVCVRWQWLVDPREEGALELSQEGMKGPVSRARAFRP